MWGKLPVLTAQGAGNDYVFGHVPQPRLVAAVHLHIYMVILRNLKRYSSATQLLASCMDDGSLSQQVPL